MADDEERLVVLLEARIKDLERNMAKASGTTERRFREMSLHSKTATKNMEQDAIRATQRINQAFAQVGTKIGAYGKAFAGGLVGGLVAGGVAGIVSQVQGVANAVAEVGDQAKIAGVNVRAFQELKFVAEQNRISVDALTDGLKEMNLRADEFILTGKGSGAEAFMRLGLSADRLKEKLKDPSALFTEIIGKLGHLDKAAQIRIADEIFGGTGGEVFVKLIDQGEKGIRDTIRAANDLGIVMDQELIDKAAEVDRQFHQITATVGTNLKTAIVEAAAALQGFLDLYNQYQGRLRGAENAAAIGAMAGNVPSPQGNSGGAADPKGSRLPSATDILREKMIEERLNNAFSAPAGSVLPTKSGSKSRSGAASRAEREREAVKELIEELEEELRLVNESDVAKRAAAASRMAGAAATDTERQKVISLTEAIYQEEEARQRVIDQMHFYQDVTKGALQDIRAAMEDGKITWEEWGNIAMNILNKVIDRIEDDLVSALFDAGSATKGVVGGGGGFFGTLLGGLSKILSFDGGGYTGSASRTGGLDGKGGFLAMVHPNETVVDHTKQRSRSGSSGSGQAVHVTSEVKVSIDKNGNLQAFVERTSQQQIGKAAPDIVNAANQQVVPIMAKYQSNKAGGDWRS